MDTLFTAFPAASYRLEFEVETPLRLPEYAGSTLRGAFGYALRRMSCVTRAPECKPCPLYRTCTYPAVFETPPPEAPVRQHYTQIPNPFVLEPPAWGERDYQPGEVLRFELVLVGRALRHLPLILLAWQRAGELGLGKERGRITLLRVLHATTPATEAPIFTAESGTLQPHPALLPPPPAPVSTCTLQLHTPMRLQHQGHPIRVADLTAQDLLMGLVRRVALLAELQLGWSVSLDFSALKHATEAIASEKNLRWRDWTRYSNRQRQEMVLGGAVGTWQLTGELTPFLPFLHLGQWLHVGKNATFGLGQYTLVP